MSQFREFRQIQFLDQHAFAIGRRAGLDGERLFKVMSDGSADSFALRNHALKAMLPGDYPNSYVAMNHDWIDLVADSEVTIRGSAEASAFLRR